MELTSFPAISLLQPHLQGMALALPLAQVLTPALTRLFQPPSKTSTQAACPPKPSLFSGARWFEPGQTGVTFAALFGSHLEGETHLTIVDPHVKTFRQIRILGEFLNAVSPAAGGILEVRLVTSRATGGFDWEYGQAEALMKLKDAVAADGIKLNVSFDESVHDRWIESSDWTILLGKGLDIWDAASCARSPQHERSISKKFALTYIRTHRGNETKGTLDNRPMD